LTGPTPEGARHRVRALMARSWSREALERQSDGIEPGTLANVMRHVDSIRPELAEHIAETYDRLWDKEPPRATAAEQAEADAAARTARYGQYAPPMAWDDADLDKPDGKPAEGWQRDKAPPRPADLVEDATWVREHGGYRLEPPAAVAERLGVSRNALDHAYRAVSRDAAKDPEQEREAG
jgi:hypothetical protein